MGYDLKIRGEAPTVTEQEVADAKLALEEIASRLDADGATKDDEYWVAFDAYQRSIRPAWRKFSYTSMSGFVEVISTTGMGKYTLAPEFDLEEPDDQDPENLDAYADYLDEQIKWLKKSSDWDDVTGIPLHKLGTNEGWIVTQDECIQALTAWDDVDVNELSAEHRKIVESERWADFIEFMLWASSHRGFEVY